MIDVGTLVFVLLLLAVLAALGWSASPGGQRRPWWTWTTRELCGAVARGARELTRARSGESQPWKRRSTSGGR